MFDIILLTSCSIISLINCIIAFKIYIKVKRVIKNIYGKQETKMKKEIYFCDKCGKEVEEPHITDVIDIKLSEFSNIWLDNLELCDNYYTILYNYLEWLNIVAQELKEEFEEE